MWNVEGCFRQAGRVVIAFAAWVACASGIIDTSFMPAYADDKNTLAGDIVSVEGAVYSRSDKASGGEAQPRPLKPGDSIYAQDVVNTASDGHVKILMKDKSIVDLGPSSLFKVDHFDNKQGGSDRQVEVSLPYGSMRAAIAQKLTGQGKFKVRTPSATMGVRGTEFIVTSQLDNLQQLGHMLSHPESVAVPAASYNGTGSGRSPASASNAGTTSVAVLQGQVDMSHHDFDAAAHSGRTPSALSQLSQAGVVSLTAGTQLSSSSSGFSGGLSTTGASNGVSGSNAAAAVTPVQIDSQQMATLSSGLKMTDNTFQKAVTIDPAAPSSVAGNSAISSSLQSAITVAVASAPPPPKINVGDVGVPGAFTTTQALGPSNVNTQQISHTVHIVISP